MHVFLSVLFIHCVIAKDVTLTPNIEDQLINGAKILNLSPGTVTIFNNKWEIVVLGDLDQWGLWINMDNTWGYHPTLPSQLKMTISGRSISSPDCDMLLSITDGLDSQTLSKYFTMVVRLDNMGDNIMAPACDSNIQNPTQPLITGDVYLVMADDAPPGNLNRTCRPAYIDPSNTCEYDIMGPNSTPAQWPFTFTINNFPSENRTTVTFEGNGYTATTCAFNENVPVNAGHNIYITGQSVNDQYEISSIYLEYGLLVTTTAQPTTTPTTNAPTKTPSSNPTNTPTTTPTTSIPTKTPSSNPTNIPTTNDPTITPTKSPSSNPTSTPTTNEPTTSVPTTNNPTINPTTSNPTTSKPTPMIPTTANPTTLMPTTSDPSTATPTTYAPTTKQPTDNPTTVSPTTPSPTTTSPTGTPSISPSSKTTAHPTRKPTNEGEQAEYSTPEGTYDDRLEVSDNSGVGTASILMITIITVLMLILLCCMVVCMKKLKCYLQLRDKYGSKVEAVKPMIIHFPNMANMQYENNMNGHGEGKNRISIVNARPEGGSHTIPMKKNEPGLNEDEKEDDEDVMDGFVDTEIMEIDKDTPGSLPKPPPRKPSPRKKKQNSTDAFIEAIIQLAQPPQIELNEVKKQQQQPMSFESKVESEPLMSEMENDIDDNVEYDINGEMIIRGDDDNNRETIDGIEKKLNEEDDYDEGMSFRSSNVVINENEDINMKVKDNKKKSGKKNSESESYIIYGSESETTK